MLSFLSTSFLQGFYRFVRSHNFILADVRNTNVCDIPHSGYKGWRDGVVTLLKPVIKRDCAKVFAKDENETSRVITENGMWRNALSDNSLLKLTKNCSWVEEYFHNNLYTTKLEREFPIAYNFVVYENTQQVLRLLKFLYRPTNFYCIHTDIKSNVGFSRTFRNLGKLRT